MHQAITHACTHSRLTVKLVNKADAAREVAAHLGSLGQFRFFVLLSIFTLNRVSTSKSIHFLCGSELYRFEEGIKMNCPSPVILCGQESKGSTDKANERRETTMWATRVLRMAVKKTTTGIVGLPVNANARQDLIKIYQKTLQEVKVR